MTNNSSFPTLSIDHLNAVTGGYHDADPTTTPSPATSCAAVVGAAGGWLAREACRLRATASAPAQ
jgi:hypothetical protein